MRSARRIAAVLTLLVAVVGINVGAQMPDPKQMSGVPLPANDLPPGTVSVRVIRGALTNNVVNHPVEFLIDGRRQTVMTDASGRAQVSGVAPTARVKATSVVDGQQLETQEAAVGQAALRFMLVATDPAATGPAVPGTVVFGPDSRVIAQLGQDRLQIFYVLDVINTAPSPVDIGGPLIIDLPREARGAGTIDGTTPQASVSGARVTVVGPFQPGSTPVTVGYEMPYSGPTARIEQQWPIDLPQATVLVAQTGQFTLRSAQLENTREVEQNGERAIIGSGPAIPAGQTLRFEIDGLPHHPVWPRRVALTLAGLILAAGIWGAVTAPRQAAAH